MDLGLARKLAVVTGSTAGIGKAIALELSKHQARVVVNGRTMESCERAKADIVRSSKCDPADIIPVPGDVGNAQGAKAFIEAVQAVGQPVDVLINNVGIFESKNFFEIDDAKWEDYFQVNVMSGVRLARTFLKQMLQRNSGRVIFISSEVGMRPLEHMVGYSASKAAQINLARGLAELTKGTNVTVNSVLPGPTMTEGVKTFLAGYAKEHNISDTAEAEKSYFTENERTSLLQRFEDPSEIAAVVAFLASSRASGINGTAQRAEGGIIRHVQPPPCCAAGQRKVRLLPLKPFCAIY